jgi:seryl-tRNA synthetase
MDADQTQGIRIPKALQPYMQGRDFIPFSVELPPKVEKKAAGKKK